jgi:hypothetical protein
MVWVITIAVFLATVVAALLVFLIYSQKEQIKRALKEKRKEERTKLEIELELATPHEPPFYEKYSTENTSRHGARVASSKRWQPHEHVLVRLPKTCRPSNTYDASLLGMTARQSLHPNWRKRWAFRTIKHTDCSETLKLRELSFKPISRPAPI